MTEAIPLSRMDADDRAVLLIVVLEALGLPWRLRVTRDGRGEFVGIEVEA